MKADRQLEWEPTYGTLKCYRAKRGARSVYEAYSDGEGRFGASRLDQGFHHRELGRDFHTMEDAQQYCQDLHNKELRRAAWDTYMLNHDPPEEESSNGVFR